MEPNRCYLSGDSGDDTLHTVLHCLFAFKPNSLALSRLHHKATGEFKVHPDVDDGWYVESGVIDTWVLRGSIACTFLDCRLVNKSWYRVMLHWLTDAVMWPLRHGETRPRGLWYDQWERINHAFHDTGDSRHRYIHVHDWPSDALSTIELPTPTVSIMFKRRRLIPMLHQPSYAYPYSIGEQSPMYFKRSLPVSQASMCPSVFWRYTVEQLFANRSLVHAHFTCGGTIEISYGFDGRDDFSVYRLDEVHVTDNLEKVAYDEALHGFADNPWFRTGIYRRMLLPVMTDVFGYTLRKNPMSTMEFRRKGGLQARLEAMMVPDGELFRNICLNMLGRCVSPGDAARHHFSMFMQCSDNGAAPTYEDWHSDGSTICTQTTINPMLPVIYSAPRTSRELRDPYVNTPRPRLWPAVWDDHPGARPNWIYRLPSYAGPHLVTAKDIHHIPVRLKSGSIPVME